jgi:hypothetical protein
MQGSLAELQQQQQQLDLAAAMNAQQQQQQQQQDAEDVQTIALQVGAAAAAAHSDPAAAAAAAAAAICTFKQQQQEQQQQHQQQIVQAYQDFLLACGVDMNSIAGSSSSSSLLATGLGVDQQTLQQLTAQLLGGTDLQMLQQQSLNHAGGLQPGFGGGVPDQGLPGSPQAMGQGFGPPGLDAPSMFAAAGEFQLYGCC